jgi:hypothetical protein
MIRSMGSALNGSQNAAATQEVTSGATSRATTRVRTPARRSTIPQERPMTPAPMTNTSIENP